MPSDPKLSRKKKTNRGDINKMDCGFFMCQSAPHMPGCNVARHPTVHVSCRGAIFSVLIMEAPVQWPVRVLRPWPASDASPKSTGKHTRSPNQSWIKSGSWTSGGRPKARSCRGFVSNCSIQPQPWGASSSHTMQSIELPWRMTGWATPKNWTESRRRLLYELTLLVAKKKTCPGSRKLLCSMMLKFHTYRSRDETCTRFRFAPVRGS